MQTQLTVLAAADSEMLSALPGKDLAGGGGGARVAAPAAQSLHCL